MNKLLIVLALIVLPQTAIAQDTGGNNDDATLEQAPDSIAVPATVPETSAPTPNKINLVIKSINKNTSRILGGVNISIESEGETGEVTTPDPPKEPEGELAFKVLPGTYKITALRSGYETVTEDVNLQSENLKLTLEFEPLSSTPNPDNEFAQRLQLMQIAQQISQSNMGFPYNNQNYPFNNGYQNYNNYPNNGYPNNQANYQNNPFGNNYNGYQTTQNGFVFNQNQANTTPLVINIPALSMISNLRNYDVRILDPTLGNEVSLSNYNNPNTGTNFLSNIYTSVAKYTCVRPGQNYVLRIYYNNNSMISQQNYQDFNFQSSTQGGFTRIDITEQQVMAFVGGNTTIATPQIQNLPITNYNLPINCPNSYNNVNSNGQFNNGNTTWGDPTVNPASFGNYSVQRSPYQDTASNGYRYFLVNNSVFNDARPITFVENESSVGGLAFVPSQSGNLYSPNYSSSQWYATTYTRNISAQLKGCSDYLSSLIKNPEFTKLEPNLQETAKKNWSDMSLAIYSTKERYELCLRTKSYLAEGFQKISVTIPTMNEVETSINVNVSKFSRVNYSPQEYSQAVAGEVLQSFNVK